VAAAEVGHARTGLELGLDALERRDPLRDDVGDVARPEEPLGALEEVVVVFVPAEALAGAEALGDVGLILDERARELERVAGDLRRIDALAAPTAAPRARG
jgi:hypothetical protein